MGLVYIDELSLMGTYQLLRLKGLRKLIVLELGSGISEKLCIWILKCKGIFVTEATFFCGHLRCENGEGVPFYARKLAAQIALDAAKQIVTQNKFLGQSNEQYGRNTIRLYFSKTLHLYVEKWMLRILAARHLMREQPSKLLLKNPNLFDGELLCKNFPDTQIHLYKTAQISVFKLLNVWYRYYLLQLKIRFRDWKNKNVDLIADTHSKPGVLLFQENTNIRLDRRLRAQPYHWIDNKHHTSSYNVFLVEKKSFKMSVSGTDKEKLKEEEAYYAKEIEKARKERDELFTSDKTLEKFAREKYFMKKDNEEVFIMIDTTNNSSH